MGTRTRLERGRAEPVFAANCALNGFAYVVRGMAAEPAPAFTAALHGIFLDDLEKKWLIRMTRTIG